MGKKNKTKKTASASEPTTKSLSTTSSGFAEQAYKNGILRPAHSTPPTNLVDMRKRLARRRRSASPPKSVYKAFVNRVEKAPNEATMLFEVGGELLKKYKDKCYLRAFNQAFTWFPENVGLNNGLSNPQPDFIEGLEKREYKPFPIDCISGAILYAANSYSVALPHIIGEWKGPGKDMIMARLQGAYAGAALIYARNQALNAIGKPYLAGHAKVISFTTDGTDLNLYAHYAAPAEGGSLEYHQYLIKSVNLIASYHGFKKGLRYLRNAQDLARKESFRLRDELMEYWKARGSRPPPTIQNDYEIVDPQDTNQPTPSKLKHGKTPSSRTTTHLSTASLSEHDYAAPSSQKRKASQGPSSASSKRRRN